MGQAVIPELLSHGHQVLALARSDSSAATLSSQAGISVLRGDLNDTDSLKKGAAQADGVIHLAFIHDFDKYAQSTEVDNRAHKAFSEVLMGTNKPFVSSSGTLFGKPGELYRETDLPDAASPPNDRRSCEVLTIDMARQGARSSVVRLSPTVHDKGDHAFVPFLIQAARKNGVAGYLGDGHNRWPAVHRQDAAVFYRLALEKGQPGSIFHAVAEEGVQTGDMARIIGKHLNMEAKSMPRDAFGFIGWPLSCDNITSSELTKKALGWEPKGISLLEDIDHDYYYAQ